MYVNIEISRDSNSCFSVIHLRFLPTRFQQEVLNLFGSNQLRNCRFCCLRQNPKCPKIEKAPMFFTWVDFRNHTSQ